MAPRGESLLFADNAAWFCRLDIKKHFDALEQEEKLYAHWMTFLGTRIILRQNSAESEGIFDLILQLYHVSKGDWSGQAIQAGITQQEMQWFLEYASMFLSSFGNYTSFSGQKFFPRLGRERFQLLAKSSPDVSARFAEAADAIYSERTTVLGYPDADQSQQSNYYPDTVKITKDEIEDVQEAMFTSSTEAENTRLRKQAQINDLNRYEVLIASVNKGPTFPSAGKITHTVKGAKADIKFSYGDHAAELNEINACLAQALKHASNATQRHVLQNYIECFQTGSIEAHKQAQSYWVSDISPTVETMLGFIEYYRDPHAVRAEWRGFVMISNKPESQAFAVLIERAQHYLQLLPWNSKLSCLAFEVDKFTRPDFMSMEAMTFVSSSIPAGTNGPNYEDVRKDCGFKNIAIRNRVIDTPPGNVSFLSSSDSVLYSSLAVDAFGMHVALHELLGHGSGKDLAETSTGTFNFNRETPPISPLTQEPIKSWYAPGQTWKALFGTSYEECRCECVALYLSLIEDVWQAFDFQEKHKDPAEIAYVGFVYLIRQGLIGLETWNPKTRTWGKAHARARFAIMKRLLEVSDDFLTINYANAQKTDLLITLDRSKLLSHGQPAISDLLLQLHIFKSTADTAKGLALFDRLSEVDCQMEQFRNRVVKTGTPRKQFVQANTVIADNEVLLKEYDASPEGIVQSWFERGV